MKTARESEPMVVFGARLRDLRKKQGLTQLMVAEQLCVDRTTYNKYEAGRVSPDQRGLLTLADLFSVSADYLLGREPEASLNVAEARVDGAVLSDQEKLLVQMFRQLPSTEQQKLVEEMQHSIHNRK